MSYILDALQRADAERSRGGVPTLHARQASSLVPTTRPNARRRMWLAVVATVVLAAIATGLWLWHAAPAPTNPVTPLVSTPSPTPNPTIPATTALPAPAPMPTTIQQAQQAPTVRPSATTAPPTAATATTPPPPSTKAPAVGSATASAKTAGTPPTVESAPPQPKPPAVTSAAVKDKATATAVPASPLAPLLSELPEPLRREIPALKVTGAVYSDNPAQRLLLVNGLVLNQGSTVAPELTLVEIRSSSSEFSFRGTLFRVTH